MADLKSGTHIKVTLHGASYHGIYVGNGFVVHLEEKTDSLGGNEIKKSTIKDFLKGTSTLYKIQYPKSLLRYTGDEITERASALLKGGYNSFVIKSSENFAVWCCTGIKSHQELNQPRSIRKAIRFSRKVIEQLKEQEFLDVKIEIIDSIDSIDSIADIVVETISSIPLDQVAVGAIGAVSNGASSVASGVTSTITNATASASTAIANTSIQSIVTAVGGGGVAALPVVSAIGVGGAAVGAVAGVGAVVAAAPVAIPLAIGVGLLALVRSSSKDVESKRNELDRNKNE